MEIEVPVIGATYKVIKGAYEGFVGACINIDLKHSLPVILQDNNWNTKAVRVSEIERVEIDAEKLDIPQEQKS